MRKKSHISLAKYIVKNVEVQELSNHKKAFYLGNILPDCKPSFITTRHEYEETYEQIKASIRNLTTDCNVFCRKERVYWRSLGEIIHYLADYFTFPHNRHYTGNLKEHCAYEQELKLYLRDYLRSGQAAAEQADFPRFGTLEELFLFIEQKHCEYRRRSSNIEADCRYIVMLCVQVVWGMIELLNQKLERVLYPVLA